MMEEYTFRAMPGEETWEVQIQGIRGTMQFRSRDINIGLHGYLFRHVATASSKERFSYFSAQKVERMWTVNATESNGKD